MKDISIVDRESVYSKAFLNFEEGTVRISYERNLDLYWTFIPKCNFLESKDEYTLKINMQDYYFYNLLDVLYDRIKNDFIYSPTIKEESRYILYKKEELLMDNKIIWYSDDDPIEIASCFVIEKTNDAYLLTFKKSSKENFSPTFAVRLSNSGSRYEPYNVIFMQHYKDLLEYDGQISIEEYNAFIKARRLK